MKKLLIASNNKGKVQEIQELLKAMEIELVTPAEINLNLDVVEDGHTYAENAIKKALAFARASNMISLADDSGLEVDVLNGAPGLYSARYGPPLALSPVLQKMGRDGQGWTDADRRAYLLQNLQDKPRPWKVRFRATIAVATPANRVELSEGTCEGEIIPEERGSGGFGYDPIFFIPELDQTMAELDMEQKNRLSHRARAVINAIPILEKMLR